MHPSVGDQAQGGWLISGLYTYWLAFSMLQNGSDALGIPSHVQNCNYPCFLRLICFIINRERESFEKHPVIAEANGMDARM